MVQTNTKNQAGRNSGTRQSDLEFFSQFPDSYLGPDGEERAYQRFTKAFPHVARVADRELREDVEDLIYAARNLQKVKPVNGLIQKLREIDFNSFSREVAGLYHNKPHPFSDKYSKLILDALKDEEALKVFDRVAAEIGTAPQVLEIVFTRLSGGKSLEIGECYRASNLLSKISFS